MMGTDTFEHSAAKEMHCPFTGRKLLALPALSPDVALIHVHRADVYGNCQIDGIIMADDDIAKASKRVIITTEKIISNDEIRREPNRTIIPYWCVDAVIEMPFGSYPGNMPGEYFSDEPAPFAGMPSTVITQSQQQNQAVQVQMLLEIQSRIDERLARLENDSPERSFLEKVKSALSSVKNATDLLSLLVRTARDFGVTTEQLASLFG